jgi:hypothetical protein
MHTYTIIPSIIALWLLRTLGYTSCSYRICTVRQPPAGTGRACVVSLHRNASVRKLRLICQCTNTHTNTHTHTMTWGSNKLATKTHAHTHQSFPMKSWRLVKRNHSQSIFSADGTHCSNTMPSPNATCTISVKQSRDKRLVLCCGGN